MTASFTHVYRSLATLAFLTALTKEDGGTRSGQGTVSLLVVALLAAGLPLGSRSVSLRTSEKGIHPLYSPPNRRLILDEEEWVATHPVVPRVFPELKEKPQEPSKFANRARFCWLRRRHREKKAASTTKRTSLRISRMVCRNFDRLEAAARADEG